jgi:hypothetical protein
MMARIQELWVRVQGRFRTPSDFERWINAHNPQCAAELEHLEKEWMHRSQINQPF